MVKAHKAHNVGKLSANNKGVTLVEVIVSLLILSIIIVPLLSGFVTAGNANRATKEQISAKAIGESVVESAKLLGVEGTAMEFYKLVSEGNSFMFAADYESANELVAEGGHPSVVETGGVKRFSKQSSGKYEYLIKGIKYGALTYDVVLNFDNSIYKNAVNGYVYADLSAYNSDTSAIINPVVSGSDYDYRAFQYFKNMHDRHTYSEYIVERGKVEERNALLWEQYYDDLEKYNKDVAAGRPAVKPDEPVTEALPVRPSLLSDDYIKQCIKKTVDISVKEGAAEGQYVVNSIITYECDNTLREFAKNDDTIVKTYSGFCNNKQYNNLQSIVLIYTPFISAEKLNGEYVNIKKECSEDLDVFLVVQDDGHADFTKSKLNVNIDTDDNNSIRLFSQAELSITPGNIDVEQKLIDYDSVTDSMYNVTVKVYRGGGTLNHCITTIDSTLVDK